MLQCLLIDNAAAVQAEKLEEKLFAANARVEHLQKARRHNRCVCAFVTFTEDKGRARCLAANPNTIGRPPECLCHLDLCNVPSCICIPAPLRERKA